MSSSFGVSVMWRTFVARVGVMSGCGPGWGVLRVWGFCVLSWYIGVGLPRCAAL